MRAPAAGETSVDGPRSPIRLELGSGHVDRPRPARGSLRKSFGRKARIITTLPMSVEFEKRLRRSPWIAAYGPLEGERFAGEILRRVSSAIHGRSQERTTHLFKPAVGTGVLQAVSLQPLPFQLS